MNEYIYSLSVYPTHFRSFYNVNKERSIPDIELEVHKNLLVDEKEFRRQLYEFLHEQGIATIGDRESCVYILLATDCKEASEKSQRAAAGLTEIVHRCTNMNGRAPIIQFRELC